MDLKASDYVRVRTALKDAPKKVRTATNKRIRAAAAPMVSEAYDEGSAQMPHRGGFSASLMARKITSVSLMSAGVYPREPR